LGKDKILEHWEAACETSRYEDGNSYSGGIGMLGGKPQWQDKQFETADEAVDFISENHDKWCAPLAVSYNNRNGELCWMIGGWCAE
jgi:hypothetical protein